MKLHLPIALLAAVLSAVAYGGEPYDKGNFTQEGDNKYVYNNSETGVTYSYETAEDGTITSTVTGNAIDTKFYNFGTWSGTVINVPYTDSDRSASNTVLNIGDSTGTASSVDTVIGAGVRGTEVLGNKTTNIHSGAEVGMAIAGYMTWNNDKYPAYEKYEQSNYNHWGASDAELNPTITLNIEGKVSSGVFGHYIGAQCISNAMNSKYPGGGPAFALKEAIDIQVNGGQVEGVIVAGGFNSRVDNTVSVTVNEGSQTKTIFGGVQNVNNNPGYVKSTHITVNGGTVDGNVYGGGRYVTDYPQGHSLVKEGTLVEINGGTVTGNVFGAGNRDTVIGGTHVVVNGNADIQGHIYGGGLDGLSTVEGDRVITFDNHGEVDWTKVHDFDAVEFTGTTTTKLGTDGQLAENYKTVTINNSYITGSIRDGHEVELDVTNNIHVALDGNLTTKAGSQIVDNENAIQIGGNATFNGTEIENSSIVAGGDISLKSGSEVTNANLVAANGDVSFDNSSMNGGEITVGGKLSLLGSDVTAQVSTEGGAVLVESTLSDLTIDGSIKLADGSSFTGINYDQVLPGWLNKQSTLTADSIEIGKDLHSHYSTFTATEGGIVIGSGASLEYTHLNAKGDIEIEQATLYAGDTPEGYTPYGSSAVTSTDGDIIVGAGSALTNTDLSAENGSVKLEGSTMNGGNIVAGEGIELRNSDVTADSLNEGADLLLTGTQGSQLTVNNDVKLNNAQLYNGSGLTADSVNVSGSAYVQDSSITAENDIELESSYVLDGSLKAEKGDVVLNNTSVNGGSIEVGGALHLAGSNVEDALLNNGGAIKVTSENVEGRVNGISVAGNLSLKDGSNMLGSAERNAYLHADSIAAEDTKVDYTKVTATKGDISFGADSEITNSSLVATKGDVVLSGTTMSDTTVTTNGKFVIGEGSNVTMDSLTGLNNIQISDSSLSTEKLVVNKGETFNVTGTDRVGDNFVLTGTGISNDEALVVDGTMNITNATMTIEGTHSQLGIGYGADGGVLNVTNSKVDLSDGTTLHIGYNANTSNSKLNISGSEFIGGSNNAWLGGGTINVTDKSTMSVCSTADDHYNYRVLMGLAGNTVNLNVASGSKFESNASQFVTNFSNGTTVNITVDNASFVQHAQINSAAAYGVKDTITYLLDSGTDAKGNKYDAVNKVYTTITAQNGGTVAFNSGVTYVGSAQDKALGYTDKKLNLNVGEGSSMSFKQMEIYANTDINFVENTTGGTFTADKITVHSGTKLDITGTGRETSSVVINGTGKPNDEAIVVDGTMNITNTNLVMNGGNSQLGIGYGADGGVLNVTNSKVDLSEGTTLHIGYNAGMDSSVLNIKNSEFIGGSNNAWLGGGTINVTENSTLSVCSTADDHYNYRVLMGLAGNTVKLNVNSGSDFISNASQFVTNFSSGTDVYIKVDGAGSTFTQNAKINSAASHGVTDTITYLLDSGTDAKGNKYDAVNNVRTVIAATNGGTVAFNSGVTYVGSAQDKALGYTDKELALIVGDKASMSFKQMELYANTVINFEKPVSDDSISGSIGGILDGSNADKYTTGGSFSADKITVHAGTKLDVKGNGTDSGSQLILNGTGISNDEALVVDGHMVVKEANLVMKGSSSQLGIGYNGNGTMEVINSKVDISEGSTLHMGYNAEYTGKLVLDNSQFVGGYNNAWLGGGELVLKNGSTMDVCNVAPKGTEYNYRTILGWDGHDMKVDISGGSTMTSAATQFITNYNSNTNVEIAVDGKDSKLTHKGETVTTKSSYKLGYSGEWVEKEVITGYKDGVAETKTVLADKDTVGRVNSGEGTTKTVAYLLDSGTDEFGAKKAAVNNVTTTIKATNGGAVEFGSDKTYIGSVQDKALGYTNKHAYLSVDSTSSMSFGDMEIYADTTIDNKGTFTAGDVTVYDGATLENLGSLSLSEVALAGGELFNAGNLSITESLELEHASLLFAATALEDASSAINFTGAQLTNFGANGSGVSIDDMVDNFGIVLTGAGAQQLIDAGKTGVDFSFTLATGDATFLSQLDTVLSIEENLADFSITVNDAILRQGDGELKNLQVTVEGDALVISGTAVIPEPTTATLSLLALAALAARRRRK